MCPTTTQILKEGAEIKLWIVLDMGMFTFLLLQMQYDLFSKNISIFVIKVVKLKKV